MNHLKTAVLSALALIAALTACSDDDHFTLSPSYLLTFSSDTVSLDTVFSNVPTATRSIWAYNRSGDGIRMSEIRLEKGNQTGFRVNVDGTYLSPSIGYRLADVELRNKDSLRIFIELTSPQNQMDTPQLVEDNLLFTLESGAVQKVNMNACSWDALQLRDVHISCDSTLEAGDTPIIIYGGITVDSTATLSIPAGTTLYFHADAGIDVYGRLITQGEPDRNVVMRGDRIDRMFDYLPYDNVSGQWEGVHLHSSSYGNILEYTDIHSTFDGIVIDSSDVDREKLLAHSTTVHNCQGYGIKAANSRMRLANCQITNTLNDCLCVDGGWAEINNCTLAQFYPFDAYRGVALRFLSTTHPLEQLTCRNTLITGYSEKEIIAEQGDSSVAFKYDFASCILRMPTVDDADTIFYRGVLFENAEDTAAITGKKHFVKIDTENLCYDFRLDSLSTAIDKADPLTATERDRHGELRDDRPDIGAYEFKKDNNGTD